MPRRAAAAAKTPDVLTPDQVELAKTDLTIQKCRKWLGFGVEVAMGAGLVGTGLYEFAHPATMLIDGLPAWQLVVGGLPLLGGGQSALRVAQKAFGALPGPKK